MGGLPTVANPARTTRIVAQLRSPHFSLALLASKDLLLCCCCCSLAAFNSPSINMALSADSLSAHRLVPKTMWMVFAAVVFQLMVLPELVKLEAPDDNDVLASIEQFLDGLINLCVSIVLWLVSLCHPIMPAAFLAGASVTCVTRANFLVLGEDDKASERLLVRSIACGIGALCVFPLDWAHILLPIIVVIVGGGFAISFIGWILDKATAAWDAFCEAWEAAGKEVDEAREAAAKNGSTPKTTATTNAPGAQGPAANAKTTTNATSAQAPARRPSVAEADAGTATTIPKHADPLMQE
jgi:hypothetical protein